MAEFDLALVLPAFNEQDRLPNTLEQLRRFAGESGLAVQIIVADDGSSDSTQEIVRRWMDRPSEESWSIDLVEIAHRGKGAAVRAGLPELDAPVVGYADVDLSAGPDAILKLYRTVKDGADVAIASRSLPGSVLEIRQPWYRERAGRVFNLILRKLARIPYRDTQCGLKLFKREVANQIQRHQRLDGFAFDAELVVLAMRLGFSVEEVPIHWAHAEGSKLSLVKDSFRMARDMLRIVRRLRKVEIQAPGVPSDAAMEMMVTSEEQHWWHVAKRDVVKQVLDQIDGSSPYLDLGCGGGALLDELNDHGTVVGADLSPHALLYAQARGLTDLAQTEASALPFKDDSFGVVFALDVVEHHPRPELLLAEIRRVLRSEGHAIITVPAFQWMWSYADYVLGHFRRYNRQELRNELSTAGFAIERITYFHSWLLPLAWTFRKLRALVTRTESADDFQLPGPMNRFFLGVSRTELKRLRRSDIPFGLSLLGVATPAHLPTEE
jgi:dolichyl-phosphate beta-glucosyltransferase